MLGIDKGKKVLAITALVMAYCSVGLARPQYHPLANRIIRELESRLPTEEIRELRKWHGVDYSQLAHAESFRLSRNLRFVHPRCECFWIVGDEEITVIRPGYERIKFPTVPEDDQGPLHELVVTLAQQPTELGSGLVVPGFPDGYHLFREWVAYINGSLCWIEAVRDTGDPNFPGKGMIAYSVELGIYCYYSLLTLYHSDKELWTFWNHCADVVRGYCPEAKAAFEKLREGNERPS